MHSTCLLMIHFFSQIFRKYNYAFEHQDNQINDLETTNPVMSSEIVNAEDDDDGVNENKRKREKEIIINDNSPVEEYYFYDNFLK